MELYKKGRLNFLNETGDTIWILESQFIDSGTNLGKIWTGQGSIDYSFQNGKLGINIYHTFTKFTCCLIQNWDTTKIRMEEKGQIPIIDSKYIYASRIIIKQEKIRIDTISFNELFNWKRDTK